MEDWGITFVWSLEQMDGLGDRLEVIFHWQFNRGVGRESYICLVFYVDDLPGPL